MKNFKKLYLYLFFIFASFCTYEAKAQVFETQEASPQQKEGADSSSNTTQNNSWFANPRAVAKPTAKKAEEKSKAATSQYHKKRNETSKLEYINNQLEEKMADLNRIDYKALPFDSAIKEVRGNGQYKVAVFSDPDCPFCKKLEHEIAQMTDVTIYTFLMPIDSLHPQATAKSIQLWCQPNRTEAWTKWMREGVSPAQVAECANPVAELTKLAESFGFNGTPTIVYPNGKVQSGYMPKADFEAALKKNQS